MDRHVSNPTEGSALLGSRTHLACGLAMLSLIAWQGWMTLSLFGPDQPWQRLLDEQPVVSGRHPLHLYHGYLGARSFREHGTLCCFDPAFEAGYPKTPLFDGGSRPAELFQLLAGKTFHPSAYKIGLAVCCLLVPILLAAAARGLGLGRGAAVVATGVGLLIWWGTPCRQLLEAGDLDLLLASLVAVTHVGILIGYDRSPGPLAWAGLLLTACLGWFAHPLVFFSLLPLHLVYYLSVGVKHRIVWHLGLLGSLAGGIAANAFWLPDWLSYWWICSPLPMAVLPLEHRTFHTIWSAELWGDAADRALAVALTLTGLIGIVILNQTKQRAAARLLALGGGGSLVLAVAGIAWEPLGRVGTAKLLAPAMWYAVLPAAHALVEGFRRLGVVLGNPRRGLVIGCGLLAAGGFGLRPFMRTFIARGRGTPPLTIGLSPQRQDLVETLVKKTGLEARILWEDQAGPNGRSATRSVSSRWTALLPLLTHRAYLGGLDPDARLEHAYSNFVDQDLAGRPIGEWCDAELEQFCQRYNIGWVVCCSGAAADRFRTWPGATLTTRLPDESGQRYLFTLKRRPSYLLKGRARWLQADWERIALADVIPEEGKVVLSLHYQAGMRVSPSWVKIEREPDPNDPIPLVRLVVPTPVARITLRWTER